MVLPTTQRKWIITGQEKGLDQWKFTEGPIPKVEDHSVLVKMHAASLNYREITMTWLQYIFEMNLPVVGGSDGAGEVIEVGSRVTKWKKGDRVATLFNPGHQSGPMDVRAFKMGSLGATRDGTFQEYAVFDETWLVRLAENLSFLEGASLSNAGVTAWNALYGLKPLKPGEWVLVQGTGGVSLFAVQFAKAGGAKVVATTSSQAKADLLKGLGADHVINYTEDRDWGNTARALTPKNTGFDIIVEIGGADTMVHSLNAIKFEGIITVIGLVTGLAPPDSILEALKRICTLRGIHVGSRVLMEEMMAGIEANKIQPVLDPRIFEMDELKEALEYLRAQRHVGKVAIKIV